MSDEASGAREGEVRTGGTAGDARRGLLLRHVRLESACDPITSDLYAAARRPRCPRRPSPRPSAAAIPTALAELGPGETVLDLGSGGGIDVLLSARASARAGKAYGLDMTDEMLALARENQRKAGVDNVEFLKGEIEQIPLPDDSVDVIISNCVINLSADKDARAGRGVPRPEARAGASRSRTSSCAARCRPRSAAASSCGSAAWRARSRSPSIAPSCRRRASRLWTIEPTRVYRVEDARDSLAKAGLDVEAMAPAIEGKFMSAFIRATKPVR